MKRILWFPVLLAALYAWASGGVSGTSPQPSTISENVINASFIDAGTIMASFVDAGVICSSGATESKGTLYADNGVEMPTNKHLYFDGSGHLVGAYWDGSYLQVTGAWNITGLYIGTSGLIAYTANTPMLLRGQWTSGLANLESIQFANNTALTTDGDIITAWYSDAAITRRAYVDYRGVFNGEMGTGTSYSKFVGTATVNVTASGNTADTSEDDLQTYSLPGNSLSANGKGVRYTAWGDGVSTANITTVKCYFGATAVVTDVLTAAQANTWRMTYEVIRTGATAQIATAILVNGGAVVASTRTNSAPAETLSGAVTMKCTGQRATTSTANSVRQLGGIVEFFN